MNKLAAISLVVFLQAVQVAQAASGEKGSDKPDDSRPARFAGTGGAAGGAERADLAAYAARVLEGSDEFLPGMEEKFTPLTKAIFDGNYGELVRLVGLRKDGTPTYDVNEVDEEGETPLLAAIHYAENFDDPWAVVDLLLKNGAYKSVNIGDSKGITPLSQVLHNIIYSGGSGAFLKVLSALLGAGADVNKESAGNIPLYKLLHSDGIKAELEVCEAAQLLLAYGADSGPLYIKKKKSGLLLAYGADPSGKDVPRLPEERMKNPAARAAMQALRENYALLKAEYASGDVTSLRKLSATARLVAGTSGEHKFSEALIGKARIILAEYQAVEAVDRARREESARIDRIDAERKLAIKTANESVKKIAGWVGQLRGAKDAAKAVLGRQIKEQCGVLRGVLERVQGLTKEAPALRRGLESEIRDLCSNPLVKGVFDTLVPAARVSVDDVSTAAGGAGGGGAAAVAAGGGAYALNEVVFGRMIEDFRKVRNKADATMFNQIKNQLFPAGMPDLDKKAKRMLGDQFKILEDLHKEDSSSAMDLVRRARKAEMPLVVLLEYLKQTSDTALKALYEEVIKISVDGRSTVMGGTVATSMGGSEMGDGDLAARLAADFGDLGEIEEEGHGSEGSRSEDEGEYSPTSAVEIPVFPLPAELDKVHVETLLRLVNREIRSLDENGLDIYKLFNALGSRFEARYDDEAAKKGNLRITDTIAARVLGEAGKDARKATVVVDPKHNENFKGPKRNLLMRAETLLSQAGISKEVVTVFAASKGIGVTAAAAAAAAPSSAAAAAAAPASSRASGYSDYASGGGRSRTGGGGAASGGGGGGWNVARGAYSSSGE